MKGFAALIICLSVLTSISAYASDMSQDAILQRIKPVGEVSVAKETPAATEQAGGEAVKLAADAGKKTYDSYCMACHTTGVSGAPKIGDKGVWKTRSKSGVKTLIEHAIKGFKLMPAKGGCASCSNDEVTAAVKYMLKESGN